MTYSYSNGQIIKPNGDVCERFHAGLLLREYATLSPIYRGVGIEELSGSLEQAIKQFDKDMKQ